LVTASSTRPRPAAAVVEHVRGLFRLKMLDGAQNA
jgi:hypothetical protein